MVSIVAFQAVDPGSIPGRRRIFFLLADSLLGMHREVGQINTGIKLPVEVGNKFTKLFCQQE